MNKPAPNILPHNEGEKAMVTALATTGSQQDLDRYAGRLKIAMRGGDKLTNPEARALAQIALVTNLDPFIGELWYIPGKGPMIGIAGARKLWNEQAGQGYSFVEFIPCTPNEAGATEKEIADKEVVGAFQAIAHDHNATQKYLAMFRDTLAMLREAGATDPFTTAKEICGPKPQWVGYGYSTKSETSRMNKLQLARKRAEADALKKCIVIPFGLGVEVAAEDQAPQYVEGTAVSVDAAMTYEEAKQFVIKVQGGEKFMGELNAEQLQYVIDNSQNPQNVEAARIVLKQDFNMESVA